ncbi:hypothetical protein DPMN_077407 [Dreissena polymorpha]|uniref:Uncharacterized protein n=1 Tax=Dreissena polymorpha TaxID=45954 RepID=A0A9D3YKE8_DREPO|nr:hypothetical protein DPMN_077407 [Dreissena polymorpha]
MAVMSSSLKSQRRYTINIRTRQQSDVERLLIKLSGHLDHKIIYRTINDEVEPRGHGTGDTNDYDYTTSKVVRTDRDTDKVYKKLKLECHGGYNHVKGHRQMHDQPPSNHSDTASVSVKENATLASVNDDYDHAEATSNDYDMPDSATADRAASASAKDDEGKYNHITNLPDPTHEESKKVSA